MTGIKPGQPALLSVHDVTPAHLPKVLRILDLLAEAGVPPATLLVVPGAGWDPDGIATLKKLVGAGHPLAGHGWGHRCDGRRTLYHRLHGLLISRDQAEHLSRPRAELVEMVARCFAWFGGVGLPEPELYVPPAWALGALGRRDLKELPFRWYEVLSGFIEATTGRIRVLPLVGYEADTTFRRVSVRLWNGLNVRAGRWASRPVRISIHPNDLELLLAEDLEKLVREPWRFVREQDRQDET